jgi:hypothetical protein
VPAVPSDFPVSHVTPPSPAASCKRSPCGTEIVPVNLILAADECSPQEFCSQMKYLRHIAWSVLCFQTCKRGVKVSGSSCAWA